MNIEDEFVQIGLSVNKRCTDTKLKNLQRSEYNVSHEDQISFGIYKSGIARGNHGISTKYNKLPRM